MKSLGELRKEKGRPGGGTQRNVRRKYSSKYHCSAFDLALKEGADILEMDLFKSLDGEIFCFSTQAQNLLIWIGISGLKAGRRKKSEICGFATVTWRRNLPER